MSKKGERKVPADMGVFMIGVAFALDLANICAEYTIIGVGGIIVDIISTGIFSFWLERYDVNLWGDKNATATLATALLDAAPFGDFFFPWTIRITYAVFTERKDVPTEVQAEQRMFRL